MAASVWAMGPIFKRKELGVRYAKLFSFEADAPENLRL
jgi:hypothetical protein